MSDEDNNLQMDCVLQARMGSTTLDIGFSINSFKSEISWLSL